MKGALGLVAKRRRIRMYCSRVREGEGGGNEKEREGCKYKKSQN